MTNNQSKLAFEPLSWKNYGVWNIRMKALLIEKDLWNGVLNPLGFEQQSQKAQATLAKYVVDDHLRLVSNAVNAYAA